MKQPAFTQAINQFRDFLRIEKKLSEHTISLYVLNIQLLANFNIIYKYPGLIHISHLSDFIQDYNKSGYSASSQSSLIASLKAFFQFLYVSDYASSNIASGLEYPVQGYRLPEIISLDDINAMVRVCNFETLQGLRDRAIIEVLFSSGVKVSELINIRISDIDWQKEFISVPNSRGIYRTIPIGYPALAALDKYFTALGYDLKNNPDFDSYIFLSPSGYPCTRDLVFDALKRAAKIAMINKPISPSIIRNTFAFYMLKGGCDYKSLADMMGYENIKNAENFANLIR